MKGRALKQHDSPNPGMVGKEDKGSKQFFAFPSMTMHGIFSTLASWIAQRTVDASGLRGEHVGVDLEIGLFFLNQKIITNKQRISQEV